MFRTELSPKKHEHSLSHTTPVLTIGSCFSDQIGGYFEKNKFDVLSNPFGTVYNPISIFKLLRFAVAQSEPEEYSYIHDQGLHSNFEFHSKFSSSDKNLLQQNIKNSIDNTHNFLKRADFLILTLGTAFAYERVENEQIVANCHKVPAKQFKKILLTESQIIKAFYGVKEELNRFNENLQIILTVSPVRHVKDTLELNAVSKSILRMVCHRLCDQYDSVHYFPSYEIVLDDLRDYRFYQRDMIHPNEIAEEYIWEKFSSAFFSNETRSLIKEWNKLQLAINHKPFNYESKEHQKFLRDTLSKLQNISQKLDVTKEIKALDKIIIQ